MKAYYHKYILDFKRPGGTSRGVLTQKETWFIVIDDGEKQGIGECGVLKGLSIDDRPNYEQKLKWVCNNIHLDLNDLLNKLIEFPSIQFGVEMALMSLKSYNKFDLFPSKFTQGEDVIPINGLVWMGDKHFMKQQIKEKLNQGFSCIKMKIGAIDFETELELLKSIRNEFSVNDVELRVDANGAFSPEDALEKLKLLSELNLHSIEQPIKVKQFEAMAQLCKSSPLDIALDEELIGIFDVTKRIELLQIINPQYIILKPSLVGGFKESSEWIRMAENQNIKWWITSALESNVGLSAIAQWTYSLSNFMPQGLGTGSLYKNNFPSPLQVENGTLRYESKQGWNLNQIEL